MALALLLVIGASQCLGADALGFADRTERARFAALEPTVHRDLREQFDPSFARFVRSATHECLHSIEEGKTVGIEIVVDIRIDGTPIDVKASTADPVATCFIAALMRYRFPSPPGRGLELLPYHTRLGWKVRDVIDG